MTFVDRTLCVPLRAEFYDGEGQLTRLLQVDPTLVTREADSWIARGLIFHEGEDETGASTTLRIDEVEVDIPLAPSLLTVPALSGIEGSQSPDGAGALRHRRLAEPWRTTPAEQISPSCPRHRGASWKKRLSCRATDPRASRADQSLPRSSRMRAAFSSTARPVISTLRQPLSRISRRAWRSSSTTTSGSA